MKKLPYPTAVLFDFDGVIVDSMICHYTAWRSAFEEMFDKDVEISFEVTHSGNAPTRVAELLAQLGGDIDLAPALNKLKLNYLMTQDTVPDLLPGVVELQQLLKQMGIPYGIASNAYTSYLNRTIEQLGLEFKTYMGVDKFESPKPSPVPYLTLAKHLGIVEMNFATTLIFEDSLTGIRAARDSGMIPIGIMTQYSEELLRANGAKMVFPSLLEVYQIMKVELL